MSNAEDAGKYRVKNQQPVVGQNIGDYNSNTQYYIKTQNNFYRSEGEPIPADAPVIWNVPFPRNPIFTGREDILEQLYARFHSSYATALSQPQAVSGLGGIGKTQIAIEYVYRHYDEYQAILWVGANSRESLVLNFVAIASLLHLPEKDEQNQYLIIEAVKNWLQMNDQWLLILDNIEDMMTIYDFLPSLGGGHVLLTTRASTLGTIAQSIDVKTMELKEGSLLLLRRAYTLAPTAELDQVLLSDDRAAAEEITQALGGLPLALDQAGAYIEETGCGVPSYLDRYRTHRTTLLKRRGKLVIDHPESVATTWSLSFQKIEQINPTAGELLRFCAFLYSDAIPEEFIIERTATLGPKLNSLVNNPITLDEVMEVLRTYSLLRRDPNTKTFSIHLLVQAVTRDSMNKNLQRKWAERAINVVSYLFPNAQEIATWPRCSRYLLHAQTCANWITYWKIASNNAAYLLNQAAGYLSEHAQYSEAELYLRLTLSIHEQTLGPNHLLVATSFNGLGTLYTRQGKYSEAESLYQRALILYEQIVESNNPLVGDILNNLAWLYTRQGKYSEAESLYQRALTINIHAVGVNHLKVASTLNGLAELYLTKSKYTEAEPLLQRAFAICEQTLFRNDPITSSILNNIAVVYMQQGKYTEAETIYQHTLAIHIQIVGPNHPKVAEILNNLAAVYMRQGKYIEAEPLLQRALTIREQTLHPNPHELAISLQSLAAVYMRQGKYTEAEPLLQRALTIREQILAFNHPLVILTLNDLIAIYTQQGKYAEAESLLQHALTIREQDGGLDHPSVADTLNDQAVVYIHQGKYAEAEPILQRALTIREQTLDPNHLKIAANLSNLAVVYKWLGKYNEAEPCYQRALSIHEHLLGSDHLSVAVILENYASYLKETKREAEAIRLIARASAIYAKPQS